MQVRHLAYGVTDSLVYEPLGRLATVDMGYGNTTDHCRLCRRENLVAVTKQQQQIWPLLFQHVGDANTAERHGTTDCGRRIARQKTVHTRDDREPVVLDVAHRVAKFVREVRPGDDQGDLETGSRAQRVDHRT